MLSNSQKLLGAGLSLILALGVTACTKDGEKLSQNACDELGASAEGVTADSLDARIINGGQCSEADSPVAQLTVLYSDGTSGVCSGALITANAVLTAGHCLYVEPAKDSSKDKQDDSEDNSDSGDTGDESASFRTIKDAITVKAVSVRVGGIDVSASSYQIHPDYAESKSGVQNDAAVVFLSSSVGIKPLPIVTSQAVKPGDVISVYGYGLDDNENLGALRSGQMEVAGITSQNVNARFQDEGSGICFGDSGGPAVLRTSKGAVGIVGIASTIGASSKKKACAEGGVANFTNVQGVLILEFLNDTVRGVGAV